MLNKLRNLKIWESLLLFIVMNMPGDLGTRLRFAVWRRRLKYLGKGVRIDVGVYFQNPQYISIGEGSWLDRNVMILAGLDESARERQRLENSEYPGEPGEVYIGQRVHIAPNVIISGISSGVYVSDECGISAGTAVYAFSNHYRSFQSPGDRKFHFGPLVDHGRQAILEGPIFIGRNTGIALSSIVLPGTTIEADSFVAIRSVLMPGSKFPENAMIAGQPAKRVGNRFKQP